MLCNAHGLLLQANRSPVRIYKSSLCSSAAFLRLDTVLSSVWKYWSKKNDDISRVKREVFRYLLGQTMTKNISEKQHVAFERSLENVSLGKSQSFYFPAKCLSPGMNMRSACHFSIFLCWNSSLGPALLFSFEFQPLWSKQKRKKFTCVLLTLFSCVILQWWMRCHQYIIQGTRNATWLKTICISAKVYIPVL